MNKTLLLVSLLAGLIFTNGIVQARDYHRYPQDAIEIGPIVIPLNQHPNKRYHNENRDERYWDKRHWDKRHWDERTWDERTWDKRHWDERHWDERLLDKRYQNR